MNTTTRRDFLKFLGRTGIAATSISLISVSTFAPSSISTFAKSPFKALLPTDQDAVVLAEGFEHYVMISRGTDLGNGNLRFGSNNDFLAFIPFDDTQEEGLLWVNHEYLNPLFIEGFSGFENRDKSQIYKEMKEVGGSIIHIKFDKSSQKWEFLSSEKYNKRLDAYTPIPFAWKEEIAGSKEAIGTLANCAGGVTPWNTVLTCEENYDMFYGERNYQTGEISESWYGWEKHFNYPPEHYGWVVEVDVFSGEAKKLVALGRCAHECATVVRAGENCVVYTGDDSKNECLYKFISKKPDSLEEGTLYVASLEKGEWISLDYEEQSILQENFESQTEVLIRLREAAKLVGGTPLDRPEDIEIDPLTGAVVVSLTNNTSKGNYFGSLLKITEENNDHKAKKFQSEVMLAGGEETGFACPDNLAFDKKGNLWFTSDISGSRMNKSPYESFKNNGLFFVPMQGDFAGKVLQVASAPRDAEFTGPFFSPEQETLFLCVQHPGEKSKGLSPDKLTSSFPNGEGEIPKSSIIAIYGKSLEEIIKD